MTFPVGYHSLHPNVSMGFLQAIRQFRDGGCLRVDQKDVSCWLEAKPLRPDGRVARPDKNAQERALDYGTVVYAERERREPLPSGQLRSGPENNRQLAGREPLENA